MQRVISIVLPLISSLVSVSAAAEGIWTTKSDMPTGRWILSTSVVDGKIYAIGGGSRYGRGALRTVEEYDPATDTWTTKSEMPTARQCPSSSVVNGKIYTIGGGETSGGNYSGTTALSTVEEYNPATDTWTTKSAMPTARFGHSASVVDGRIYVIGGAPSCPWCGTILTLEVYEPATDTWTRKGDIPRPIITASTSVVDGKIYAIGGEGTGRRVDEYDPVTDTWIRKADMPSNRTDLASSVVDGKIYAFGGDGPAIVATVDVYDPATDTWTTAPDMPTARSGLAASAVNGRIYAIGGLASWGGTALRTVEGYDPNPLVVDFNGDGIVDGKDLLIMTAHWGEDYPSCDIGPLPFGDGVVDVQDVIVLAEHIGKEVDDLTLVAHWALDETEGIVAHDSVGGNDGTVTGVAAWQPEGGIVKGALEFNGTTFVITDFVIDPSAGPFSVLAWIKGGAPSQAIISQQAGANWLMFDPATGTLMTELRSGGRFGKPLYSDAVISAGDWHRVGFTWDGSTRRLYADDILVAEDTQTGLAEAYGGLNIGTGKNLTASTLFTGLIDDVRIYSRAVKP